MNSMQIKDKIRNIAKNKNIDFNILFRLYMYDRFIERLAASKYKDNFILKGGFYLSTFFGIENRTTMDIDTAVKNINFTKENIVKCVKEIIMIDLKDHAILEITDVADIRQENKYGGYRLTIKVSIENIRETFQIDIATDDPITPGAITYNYLPILGEKRIKLLSYNNETILAEKLETILNRAEANSRIRDYYDVYLIYTLAKKEINVDILRKAVENTFKKRGFKKDIILVFEAIKKSEILKKRWNAYSRKNEYANEISYEVIMEILKEVINLLELVIV